MSVLESRKDITDLFSSFPYLSEDTNDVADQRPGVASEDSVGPFLVIDPLGILEHLSSGRLRDPIRHGLLGLISDSDGHC